MNTVLTILLNLIIFSSGVVVGLNLGLSYGLTAKPTLDLSQCQIITRYEDNSLVCDPDGLETDAEATAPLETATDGIQGSPNTIQVTADAHTLQPAIRN